MVTNGATPPAQLKNVIVSESEMTFNNLTSGTAIKLTGSGRNSKGGKSSATDSVNATVP